MWDVVRFQEAGEYAGRAEGVCVEGTKNQDRGVGGVCMGFEVGIGGGEEGAGDEHWELLIGRKSPRGGF